MYAHMYKHTHTHTKCMHTYKHTHTHAHTLTQNVCTYVQTHTHAIHTHTTHTHTHTQTQTHAHTQRLCCLYLLSFFIVGHGTLIGLVLSQYNGVFEAVGLPLHTHTAHHGPAILHWPAPLHKDTPAHRSRPQHLCGPHARNITKLKLTTVPFKNKFWKIQNGWWEWGGGGGGEGVAGDFTWGLHQWLGCFSGVLHGCSYISYTSLGEHVYWWNEQSVF